MWVLDMDVDKVQSVVIMCASYLTYKPMSIIDTAVNVTIRKLYCSRMYNLIFCVCVFRMGFFATIGKLFSRIARSRYKAVSDDMEVIVETSSFKAITQQDGG